MRNIEVVEQLKSGGKCLYLDAGIPQSSFSMSLTKMKAGIMKPNTMNRFLKQFGYEGSYNDWHLKEGLTQPKFIK